MCHVATQLWVCAESNYLCKHRVTLNTHTQSTIARTSLPFSVASRLLRTFEPLVVHSEIYTTIFLLLSSSVFVDPGGEGLGGNARFDEAYLFVEELREAALIALRVEVANDGE